MDEETRAVINNLESSIRILVDRIDRLETQTNRMNSNITKLGFDFVLLKQVVGDVGMSID